MGIKNSNRKWLSRGLSIRQRLTLLVCTLLLVVVIVFSWTSYLGVKKASVKAGEERLKTLTSQLSTMFGQSSQNFLTSIKANAAHDTIRRFLASGGKELKDESLKLLEGMHPDSLNVLIELYNEKKEPLLRTGKEDVLLKADRPGIISLMSIRPDSSSIGKIFLSGNSMYYPVVATVMKNNQVAGYLVKWRLLHTTQQAIDQFSKLIGTNATMYIGNKDGGVWTDLSNPVPAPPAQLGPPGSIFEFSNKISGRIIAINQPIPATPWQVLVGFPKKTLLQGSSKFLRSTIIIGIILIVIAMIAAWILSISLTNPLKKLTAASSTIAAGDYSTSVPIERKDEIGKLARAFNAMTYQVNMAHIDLEKKVAERTAQLKASNQELEAFSYSVSHDLRAPLRAISGYSVILKEEYGSKLGDEANRLTNKIISRAEMMGKLIDSLISFSQMGASEIIFHTVNMNKLAEICIQELLQYEPADKYELTLKPLPACQGDIDLLKQVWMNLVSNAIKYSSKVARPVIEIGCNEGPDMNIYYVKDNGIGFDMKYAHKLFGVFQRLHSQKDFEGTGIGLAFTKRIINRHQGDIWAESEPGAGTCFYFSLPVSRNNKISEREIQTVNQTI